MHVSEGMSQVILSVGPSHTLRDAARMMAEKRTGAALVIDEESPGPRIITEETKKEMKRVLDDIQKGRFVSRFLTDNKIGNPEMKAARALQRTHPIEQVGAELRAMMPWIGAGKLVDRDKN